MTSEDKKEREEYVKKYGQQIINDMNFMPWPKLRKYEQVFIRCVDHVFGSGWMGSTTMTLLLCMQ